MEQRAGRSSDPRRQGDRTAAVLAGRAVARLRPVLGASASCVVLAPTSGSELLAEADAQDRLAQDHAWGSRERNACRYAARVLRAVAEGRDTSEIDP